MSVAQTIRTTEPVSSAQSAESSSNRNVESDPCVAVHQANGTLSILNYRFGQDPKRRLLTAEAAGHRLLTVAASLVALTEKARYRVTAARIAAVNHHPMAKDLLHDAQDADERRWMAADVFVRELDMVDRHGVVVVKGHACYRNPADGRKADCVRLDGKAPCDACQGAGVYIAFGSPAYCDLCSGSGVSPHPAWLPACLADVLNLLPAAAPSWLDVPVPAMTPVDPALQRLVDDFGLEF